MLSEDEEDEEMARREVGSVPGSVVGMVRTLPEVSVVGALMTSVSSSESDPPGEKLQASDTSKGRMRARIGSLELRDIFYSLIMNGKVWWNENEYSKYDKQGQ
jgi:hypothetical protein